jgi:hypothetical protein
MVTDAASAQDGIAPAAMSPMPVHRVTWSG